MKRVLFNLDKNQIFQTYTRKEYDRYPIDSILYQRSLNRISNTQWDNIYNTLDLFKLYQMPVHKDSLSNNLYHKKIFK